MQIISRAAWGARPPKTGPVHVDPSRRAYYVVHYSGAPATQSVRAIQDWCMNDPPHGRGFSDIDYNFLIRGTTGEIYEGRGWDVVGSHTVGYNTSGIGVCVISDGPISAAAKAAVRWLYDQAGARCKKTLTIKGHRELATTGTDCPGATIFAWVRAGLLIEEDDVTPDDIKNAVRDVLKEGEEAAIDGSRPIVTQRGRDVRNALWKIGERNSNAIIGAVAGVDEAVMAKLADPATPDEAVAAALGQLLGDRKDAVVALMQRT